MGKNKKTLLLNGACGRMGQAITNACKNSKEFNIAYALENPKHRMIGKGLYSEQDREEYSLKNILIEKSIKKFKVDFVVDFSTPNSALKIARQVYDLKIPFVTGTTGFSSRQLKSLQFLSKKIPILQSYNMSLGINVLLKILRENMSYFRTTDMEIIETHHKDKMDNPSGTAILIGNTISKLINKNLDKIENFRGKSNLIKRRPGEIGISVIRGGDVVGEHTVASFGKKENIFITHQALDRTIFANGALSMAKKLLKKKKGFYSILDLL